MNSFAKVYYINTRWSLAKLELSFVTNFCHNSQLLRTLSLANSIDFPELLPGWENQCGVQNRKERV
jgi:hypothetical protein